MEETQGKEVARLVLF